MLMTLKQFVAWVSKALIEDAPTPAFCVVRLGDWVVAHSCRPMAVGEVLEMVAQLRDAAREDALSPAAYLAFDQSLAGAELVN